MMLNEFMEWLHQDRNNWVRTSPGELLNYLEDAYEQLQQQHHSKIKSAEELEQLPLDAILIDRKNVAWQRINDSEMWANTKYQHTTSQILLANYTPLHAIYIPEKN